MPENRAAERSAALDLDRRRVLKLLAGGMALTASACGRPDEEIVPYVEMPEGLTPGLPLYFATALSLAGYGRGALVTSHEGRPTKIEGNPRHPDSLGASDAFMQAAVISLYQPDRSKAASNDQGLSSWDAFSTALLAQMQKEKARKGAGLRILTGRVTSPTSVRQIQSLLKAFPEARWFRYEPIHDDAALAGAAMAFGRPLTPLPRIADASVLLSFGADPLGPGPEQIRLANGFAKARRAKSHADRVLRIYAAESSWTLTGANADERLALAPEFIHNLALEVARGFGAGAPAGPLPEQAQRFARAVTHDLQANAGRAIALAGREQPPEIHALCCWLNAQLRAPVDYIAPVDPTPSGHAQSLRELASDLQHAKVQTLFVIDSNPAYAAPADLRLGELIAAVPFSVHLGLCEDETAALCKWRLPLSHALESWSDLRAFQGTASIVQPLIRPLYDTRTTHQLLAFIGGEVSASSYQLVRETWQAQSSDFETSWRKWLQDGVIEVGSQAPVRPLAAKLINLKPATPPKGLTLALAPDPSIWDGSFCNNPWLQECAKPLTKEVWGNALHVSPGDAAAHGLEDGDIVSLTRDRFTIEAPVQVVKGQAEGVLGATLGYGRSRAGAIGNDIGFDAYRLQSVDSPWIVKDVGIARTGRRKEILTTQHSFELDADAKDILPTLTFQDLARGEVELPKAHELASLLPEWRYDSYKWAMVIDTSVCIGCNACVVACQSENNVPIVGPNEIAMGRDMHWLRVDVYFSDGEAQPRGFQPVPCMHCEYAPCEPVCPVAASVHDSEGLNVQVYNRCVGTRFCESNCPYKVRRFNFFGYADSETYANLGESPVQAHFNPDVTVRARGVMEKCTYCVQRISRARREAEKENRRIAEGEVVTACQAACPTRAITFGDLNDPASPIHALRKEPNHYSLLGHLGTKPRTTYLARLKNPDPTLQTKES